MTSIMGAACYGATNPDLVFQFLFGTLSAILGHAADGRALTYLCNFYGEFGREHGSSPNVLPQGMPDGLDQARLASR